MNQDLQALAEILAQWVDEVPGIPAIYLFGSRVRGDHRPDSDVDVRVYFSEWDACDVTTQWWGKQNLTEFAELKARLPGPLKIHAEKGADVDIRKGKLSPVLRVRKVICVLTPPKPE